MTSAILSSLLSAGLGALLGFFQDYMAKRRSDAALRDLGQTETTAAVNKETSDANRRAADAAVNAPPIDRMLDDMDRGKF